MPVVKIADNCAIAVGSVVMKHVPPNCIVAENPARTIEKEIETGRWGGEGSVRFRRGGLTVRARLV